MPYITQDDRMKFDAMLQEFEELRTTHDLSEGDMNYLITHLLHQWIKSRGIRYAHLNSAIGVLECAKLELYRTVAAPYEDTKIEENGPVSVLQEEK